MEGDGAASAELSSDEALADADERFWRRLASVVALLAAAVLIAMVVIVARSNSARDAAIARERHSYELMLVTGSLGDALAEAEAALGHFVVNGDKRIGSAVSDRWSLAGSLIERLDDMTAANAAEHRLVGELRRLYAKRGREFGDPAIRAYFRQGNPALNLFDAAGRSPTGPQIATILKHLTDAERVSLSRNAQQAEASVDHSNRMAELLSGIAIIMVLGTAMMGATAFRATAQRHLARRNLRRATERADTLEARVADRTRELERANEQLKQEAAERALAEAQLHQAQKMEAVGQLTGGIAHDFNNMLAVVVGGLDLARKRLTSETDEVGRHIESAMEGANRAAALTRRLLAFARAEPLLPERVDPARLLAGMSDLLDRTLGERIRVETVLEPDLWSLWVDPHQLENALLNLAVNARDAMEGQGTLRMAARNVVLARGEISDAQPGDYIRIEVTDTGCGIPQEVIGRVFEPFFTTKEVNKGTGLGLSQIFGFARQSGGAVTISSTPGAGTSVSLYLPRSDRSPASGEDTVTPGPAAEPLSASARRVILVVEDDARVRRTTVDALAELGQEPISCTNGEEALAVLAKRQDISLMITDVVMPGMTGPELVQRALTRYPDLPVLFVTGYVGEAGDAAELRGHVILRKPFTVTALAEAVAAAGARPLSGSSHPAGAGARG